MLKASPLRLGRVGVRSLVERFYERLGFLAAARRADISVWEKPNGEGIRT
jgi:hypothetical protein